MTIPGIIPNPGTSGSSSLPSNRLCIPKQMPKKGRPALRYVCRALEPPLLVDGLHGLSIPTHTRKENCTRIQNLIRRADVLHLVPKRFDRIPEVTSRFLPHNPTETPCLMSYH